MWYTQWMTRQTQFRVHRGTHGKLQQWRCSKGRKKKKKNRDRICGIVSIKGRARMGLDR